MPSAPPLPIKRRRRWIWWITTILILALPVVFALPYLAAVPAIRDQALKWLSARANLQITAKELSLGWFSPIALGDINVQNDDSHQAVLAVKRIEGDTALWRLLMSHDAGSFRIVQPQLNIEFDKGGWNLTRLLQAMASAALMNKRDTVGNCRRQFVAARTEFHATTGSRKFEPAGRDHSRHRKSARCAGAARRSNPIAP